MTGTKGKDDKIDTIIRTINGNQAGSEGSDDGRTPRREQRMGEIQKETKANKVMGVKGKIHRTSKEDKIMVICYCQ